MRQLVRVLVGRTSRGVSRGVVSGISLMSISVFAVGCASHSLMPAAQSEAIRDRERALASRSDVIQSAIRQSGKVGALAFLDARDQTNAVSMPAAATFVYRADVPKAPETVTASALQQEQTSAAALATDLRRLQDRLELVQRELAATRGDTDKAVADMRALADDLESVRKFMLQTAQLGWLNHELTLENASGVRKMAATSQELSASSARLEDSMRQLSESLAGQLKEVAARLDAIQGKIQNIK